MINQVEIMIAAVIVPIAFITVFTGPWHTLFNPISRQNVGFDLSVADRAHVACRRLSTCTSRNVTFMLRWDSVFVAMLNLRLRRNSEPVSLHERYVVDDRVGQS